MSAAKVIYTRGLCVALREDAGQVGDLAMVAVCERALRGSAHAEREVVRVVRAAKAAGKGLDR